MILLIIGAAIALNNLGYFDFEENHLKKIIIISICAFVGGVFVINYYKNYLKIPSFRERTGVIIAVDALNYKEYEYIYDNFYSKFKREIEQHDSNIQVKIVPYLRYNRSKYMDNYISISNAKIAILAQEESGKEDSKEKHEIKTKFFFDEENIQEEIVNSLKLGFETFSKEYAIINDSLQATQNIRKEIDIISKFLIGIINHASRKYDNAVESFKILDKTLKENKISNNNIVRVRNSYKLFYLDAHRQIIKKVFEKYKKNKNDIEKNELKQRIDLMWRILNKSKDNNLIGKTHMVDSSYTFYITRSINDAERKVKEVRKRIPNEIGVDYSEAFLLAYKGNLKESIKKYRFILTKEYDEMLDIEDYIYSIVKDEPDKIQFHFILGLLNFIGKKDNLIAEREFREFIYKSKETRKYTNYISLAEEQIKKIQGCI